MIEGCIVAKLVLGYLKQEGLYRTCSAFQDECSLFHGSNKELDNVFLTADLKTILDDYSQLRESGRENGLPRSTAVLKSLWKDLDVVIGQLKYATIPSNTPKPSMSQSTRTRRFNSARARRSMLPRTQESLASRTPSPSATQHATRTNVNNTTEKLPLPRLSTINSAPDLLKPSKYSPVLPFTSTSRVVPNGIQSIVGKEPVNLHRTPSTVQSIGSAVAITSPCVSGGHQVAKTSTDVTTTIFTIGNSNNELSRNGDIVEGIFDGMDDGSAFNDQEFSDMRTENKSPPVIVIDDNERVKEQGVLTVEEHSLSHSHQNQSELHLRSPKRKGIQPKKRILQVATGMSTVNDSPVKLVPESAEVEMDLISSSDSLTPQSFLGTLLNTPLLQERLAENINKVVGSARQHPVSDEPPSDTVQSLTTTEASSDDMLMTSNQGPGGDIPVKEIMDLMQGDPAFDVLFSFFGLDALDALPSAEHSASTLFPETSAGSSQPEKSTSCVSSSVINLADALEASPFVEECQSVSGTEITPMLPTASDQQVESPRSSSASDLHLSATSIVTDALLLLAGSPQKMPLQSQSQLDRSASVLTSGKRNPVTPPKKTQSVQQQSANDKQPRVDSLPRQGGLITSTFPYVRALDFNINKGLEPVKSGPRKGSRSKRVAKQKTATDQQSKAPLTKKEGGGNKRQLQTSKSTPSSNTAVGYRNTQAVLPSFIATNVYSGIGPPLPNCDTAFNHSRNTISSPVSLVVPSVCHNTQPYNVVSCGTLPTRSPISVCSQTTTPSILSAEPVPPAVTCTHPRLDPSTSPVALVNSINYPVNFTSAVTSHSSSPGSNTSSGNSPVRVNHNHSSSCLIPVAANLSTYGSVHVLSPLIPSSAGSVFTPAPVNLISQHKTVAPSAVGFMNPITCPVPSPSVHLANGANSGPALPTSLAVSSLSSLHHVVNTVASSPLTDPSVVSSNTSSSNSLTSQEQNVGESSRTRTSSTHGVVTQATDAVVTPVIDPGVTPVIDPGVGQTPVNALSLQASNLLQSLAVQHANTEKNEQRNTASAQMAIQLRKENGQSLEKITALSTSELVRGQQPLKDKSEQNVNLSKDSTIMPSEKHKDDISHFKSPSVGPSLEKGLRDNVTVAGCLPNSPQNNNEGTTTLVIMNQGCREPMKENSADFLQTGTSSETEGEGSSRPRKKRRRDSLQKEKEKKTKSLSRPSKRSKTKADSINFPSDLNVEEFLSKLHYEVK